MSVSSFCVFILSHGRADNVETYKTLRKQGYTGPIKIIIDDEDKEAEQYKAKYGDDVYVFDKRKAWELTDDASTDKDNLAAVVYARNMCHSIAAELGYDYFLELDDDYKGFYFRVADGKKLKAIPTKRLDIIFSKFIKFLQDTNSDCICMSQGGDFIGGIGNKFFYKGLSRKIMNSFFCATNKPFKFYGRINEDTTAYVYGGSLGKKFFTYTKFMLVQEITQKNKGGLTELYLDKGTFVKSFYSVIWSPSCVCVAGMGNKNRRLHHKIRWDNAVPKILNEKYKKH